MRFAIATGSLLLASACATAGKTGVPALDNFPPDVTGGPRVSWYDVHGRTAAELDADLRSEGPKSGGRPIIDEQWYPIRFQYRERTSNNISCWVEDARAYVDARLILPRFTPGPDADPNLAGQWNAYEQVLLQHEIGHKNIAGQAAEELATRLNTFSTSCLRFGQELYSLTQSIVAAEQKAQAQYDQETYGAIERSTVEKPVASIAFAPPGRRPDAEAASDTGRQRATAPREYVSPLAEPTLADVAKKVARVTARPDTLTLGVGGLVQLDAFTVTVFDSSGAELRHLINGEYDIRLTPCTHMSGSGRVYRATSEGTCEIELAFPRNAWTRPDSAPSARVLLRFTR